MTATPTQTRPCIRWMIRSDLPDVLEIEQLCFQFPWSEKDFVRTLRQKTCIGMVLEVGDKKTGSEIIGYMVYELHKGRIELLNLAVESTTWKKGVGRALIEWLKAKLSARRRRAITVIVREHNTGAQEFFKALGFKARGVVHDYYPEEDTAEDGYLFRYRHQQREGQEAGRD